MKKFATIVSVAMAVSMEAQAATVRLEWVLPDMTNSGAYMTPAAIKYTELRCGDVSKKFLGPVTSGYVSIDLPAQCVLVTNHIDTSDAIEWITDPATGESQMNDPNRTVQSPRDSMASEIFFIDPRSRCQISGEVRFPSPWPRYGSPTLASACVDPHVSLPLESQIPKLREAIATNPILSDLLKSGKWDQLAAALNASTENSVWMPRVSAAQFTDRDFPWNSLDSMSAAKWRIMDAMLSREYIVPSDAATRAGLIDALGQEKTSVLLAQFTRRATVLESLYMEAGNPGTLVVYGFVTGDFLRSTLQ